MPLLLPPRHCLIALSSLLPPPDGAHAAALLPRLLRINHAMMPWLLQQRARRAAVYARMYHHE